MSNPFMALDLSDDENITVVKPVAEAKVEKKHHTTHSGVDSKPHAHAPRKELKKEEENLKQKKKGPPGSRGSLPQPEVTHPGERSKIGLKKEEHVNTHKHPSDGEQRRGRQFERHSGTGRGREIKKGGAGGHNWGKAGEETPPVAATPEPAAGEAGANPAAPAATEEPVVEEDPTLTLDEYQKLQAAKRSGAAFEEKVARKVTTEVVGKAYKKDEDLGEGNYIKLGNDEHEAKKKPSSGKNKTKQTLEINFVVRDSNAAEPRRRPEGGGRGGGSGGASRSREEGGAPRGREGTFRGRGQPRGQPRGPVAAAGRIDTADSVAFPKLGGVA